MNFRRFRVFTPIPCVSRILLRHIGSTLLFLGAALITFGGHLAPAPENSLASAKNLTGAWKVSNLNRGAQVDPLGTPDLARIAGSIAKLQKAVGGGGTLVGRQVVRNAAPKNTALSDRGFCAPPVVVTDTSVVPARSSDLPKIIISTIIS